MALTKMDEYVNVAPDINIGEVTTNEGANYAAIAPISLNGATVAGTINVTGKKNIELQPHFMTNTTAELLFSFGTTVAAATAVGVVENKNVRKIFLSGQTSVAYLLSSATDGAAVTGGATDYLRVVGNE